VTESIRESAFSRLPSAFAPEKLFARAFYRPTMGLSPLFVGKYFKNSERPGLLAERYNLLACAPEDFVCECASKRELGIVGKFARRWNPELSARNFVELGRQWEPDFIVLDRRPPNRVLGGCVCFPTGWSLPEKCAHPVSFAHASVPALNALLGSQISQFLGVLGADKFYQRTNWGLTSSNQLNQHPKQQIPLIQPGATWADIFLRVEWQAFGAISTGLILFGIRIFHVSLEHLRQNPEAVMLLARNLETMPPEMLQYKRLHGCRDHLVNLLKKG
jgi:hypothetical protein